MEAPVVNVGILTQKAISFVFNGEYIWTETGRFLTGEQRALLVGNKVVFNGKMYNELFFEPSSPDVSFDLKAVTIGVNFHWQRNEDQRFKGALNLIVNGDGITAINQVEVEEYLTSVISSEMSATASKALLMAHAVISRSWLLAQIEKNLHIAHRPNRVYQSSYQDKDKLIKWYDREDHVLFDVCADDHCQRYQGITRESTPLVKTAIKETHGEVLMHNGVICDARFSKSCGGVTEEFENCWEPVHHSYLVALRDNSKEKTFPDLTKEDEADKWIRTAPDAFCNTNDHTILSQVLNNYDQETTDFYRWKVNYKQAELSALIKERSGIDFGDILDIIPMKRGSSGRIIELKIVGTKRTFTIGKELEIRRTLSTTHLYSSAFVVDKVFDNGKQKKVPDGFILIGAGWGHGVGLCQIGAAVMGAKGYDYKQILTHYFPGATIEQKY